MECSIRRRRIVTLASLAAACAAAPVGALTLTPPQTAGPFYPDIMPEDDDADLTQVRGSDRVALGEITELTGRVLDASGRPIAGARVEIWQCDANGRYRHSRERGGREPDNGFQGFGHAVCDSDGGYRFLTIRPVPYPGRTPHIHYLVELPDGGRLVTQLYVAGDPGNAGDGLYRRLDESARKACTVPFETDGELLAARFDLVLGTGNLTPA